MHTLSDCRECAKAHYDLQHSIPGPVYEPPSLISSETERLATQNCSNQAQMNNVTRQVLSELDSVYQSTYGHSFTNAVVALPHSSVQKKQTQAEKKKMKRNIQRECRNTISQQYRETDALTVLAEGQSLSSYNRIRKAQSFESPSEKQKRASEKPHKDRKHSPSFENVTWKKDEVLAALKDWPQDEKINWSKFAREHNIPSKNGGQTAKEFAKQNGINTEILEKQKPKIITRSQKKRLPGANISVPVHATVEQIKEDWQSMIERGELHLGEQCIPRTLVRYKTDKGKLEKTYTTVYGRKIPLLTLRQKLLEKHEKFMHLLSDEELAQMSHAALTEIAKQGNIYIDEEATTDELRQKISQCQRTRHIAMWHDHATVAGQGYIVITVKVLYDPAVFRCPSESENKDLQAYVEEPEIHLIALSSSCVDDQVTLIDERLQCIEELHNTVVTSNQVCITDKLLFFCGDKPAAQFERGTQIGGNYPCGSCGCKVDRMDDLAYSLQCNWKSYQDLQTLVLSGKH